MYPSKADEADVTRIMERLKRIKREPLPEPKNIEPFHILSTKYLKLKMMAVKNETNLEERIEKYQDFVINYLPTDIRKNALGEMVKISRGKTMREREEYFQKSQEYLDRHFKTNSPQPAFLKAKMNIGKLKKFVFVDIGHKRDEYLFLYLLFSKKLFKKYYFKFYFIAKYPHYLFTDIIKIMNHEGVLFEHLIGTSVDISIGRVSVSLFSQNDELEFSLDHYAWKSIFFEEARNKQDLYTRKFDEKYGEPVNLGISHVWRILE